MRIGKLAWLGMLAIGLPTLAGATSVNLPLTHEGGPYLAGFEVETMTDQVNGQEIQAIRYLARLSWKPQKYTGLSLRIGGSDMNVSTTIHGQGVNFDGTPKMALGLGASQMVPLADTRFSFFADAQLLYTLSYGTTAFETTIQSSTFREDYENRYAWNEIQGALGMQTEIAWGRVYAGAVVRSVDGSVSRKTWQTGTLVVDEREDFSKSPTSFAMFGLDIPFANRFQFSVNAQGRDENRYGWAVAITEFSR